MKCRHLTSALIALLVGSELALPAFALECPTRQPLAKPGVLKETQAQIEATGKLLSSGDVGRETSTVIADLRNRYPQVESGEIANYLITAYCPVIAKTAALSEPDKSVRMDQFVSQLMQKLY